MADLIKQRGKKIRLEITDKEMEFTCGCISKLSLADAFMPSDNNFTCNLRSNKKEFSFFFTCWKSMNHFRSLVGRCFMALFFNYHQTACYLAIISSKFFSQLLREKKMKQFHSRDSGDVVGYSCCFFKKKILITLYKHFTTLITVCSDGWTIRFSLAGWTRWCPNWWKSHGKRETRRGAEPARACAAISGCFLDISIDLHLDGLP